MYFYIKTWRKYLILYFYTPLIGVREKPRGAPESLPPVRQQRVNILRCTNLVNNLILYVLHFRVRGTPQFPNLIWGSWGPGGKGKGIRGSFPLPSLAPPMLFSMQRMGILYTQMYSYTYLE